MPTPEQIAAALARTETRYTERLWSEEVGMAEANEPVQANIAYRFSNGRTFAELTYDDQ